MVALNMQTPDLCQQLNAGLFRQNGGSGFVEKPLKTDLMAACCSDKVPENTVSATIQLIAGRWLRAWDAENMNFFCWNFQFFDAF